MNDINKLDKEIPDTAHVFQVDVVGQVTRKRFLGEFRCRVPTLKDQCLIGKHEATLNGEYGSFLAPGIQKLHKMVAYLRYSIVDSPIFWKDSDLGYALRDANVVEAVYDEVIAFEEKWLESIWGKEEVNEPKKD